MVLFWQFFVFFLFLFIGSNARAAGSARICNYVGQDVLVALGWHDYLRPQAGGWYLIQKDTCKRLTIPNADSLLDMYAYAIGKDGTEYRPSGRSEKFCIERGENFEYGLLTCAVINEAAKSVTGSKTDFAKVEEFRVMTQQSFGEYTWDIRREQIPQNKSADITQTPAKPPPPPPPPPSTKVTAGNTRNNCVPAASVDAPYIKTGDTYLTEYLHPDKPESNYILERKVVSVGAGKIEVASRNIKSKAGKPRTLQFTSEWNLVSTRNADGSGFDYSPPLKYFEFPLCPGKTWRQTSRETNIQTGAVREHTVSATVGDWEDITVPAGTFRAIKLIIETELKDRTTDQNSTGADVSWYAPNIRRSAKSLITSRNLEGQQERQLIQIIQHDLK